MDRRRVAALLLSHACSGSTDWVRKLVRYLVVNAGYIRSADDVACHVGLRNRFQLSRRLRRMSLPQLSIAAGWIRVLLWVLEYEELGHSLSAQALSKGCGPSHFYHVVQRVTGDPWSVVRDRGSTWVLQEIKQILNPPRLSGSSAGERIIRRNGTRRYAI